MESISVKGKIVEIGSGQTTASIFGNFTIYSRIIVKGQDGTDYNVENVLVRSAVEAAAMIGAEGEFVFGKDDYYKHLAIFIDCDGKALHIFDDKYTAEHNSIKSTVMMPVYAFGLTAIVSLFMDFVPAAVVFGTIAVLYYAIKLPKMNKYSKLRNAMHKYDIDSLKSGTVNI